jgi:F1F0 ATPase subunit 2
MTMSELLLLASACAGGLLLGAFFFGGLWWTLRRGLASERPALWFFGSLLLRTSIILAGFYFISGGTWERSVACLLGFVIARFVATSRRLASVGRRNLQENEVEHAPQS